MTLTKINVFTPCPHETNPSLCGRPHARRHEIHIITLKQLVQKLKFNYNMIIINLKLYMYQ